jgi:hypothetical protein
VERARSKWEIELNTWPRKLIAIGLTLGVCGFMFYQTWWLFLAAWITRDGTPDPAIYERAIQYDPENADYRFTLAQIYNYSTQYLDLEKAREQYEAAARLNPYRSAHWLELSKYYEQDGEADRAREAMLKALETDPNYAQTHWSAANLYLRLGDYEAADYQMRRAADLDVAYLTQVLDLVWRFYGDPELIMRTHVPNTKDANQIALGYFIGQDNAVGADLAWARLEGFRTEPPERFGYVEYLLRRGLPDDAYTVFGHRMPAEDVAGVFNGGFETDPMNGGFDWQYSSTANEEVRRVTTEPKDGFGSLRIEFGGEANVNYQRVSHRLSVDAGQSYQLRFWMRTEGISTDQGVYVEIEGQRSDAPLGTAYWQEFVIPFTATSDLAVIRVRRSPSEKLDNQIEGTVWLDEFSLEPVAAETGNVPG